MHVEHLGESYGSTTNLWLKLTSFNIELYVTSSSALLKVMAICSNACTIIAALRADLASEALEPHPLERHDAHSVVLGRPAFNRA